jgi:hypothetical protein
LVDFQSIKDGPFCFLLTYKDDGSKFGDNAALTSKNAYAVALALLDMWSTMGPPAILACDNGGEFSGLGNNVKKAKNVHLTDEVHASWYLLRLHPHPTGPFP